MRDKRDKKEMNELGQSYSYILQFAINMIVPIGACTYAGYWLDCKFGTAYIVIIGFFLGALAGGTSIYRITKKMTKKDKTSYTYPVVDKEDQEESDDKLP